MRENCPHCKVHHGHRAGCPLADVESKRTDISLEAYHQFLQDKSAAPQDFGVPVEPADIHPWLKPHQRAAVEWAVRGGRRALFESFGLGKTVQQLEILRLILKHFPGRGLIVAPLGVRQEFQHDAAQVGIELKFVRSIKECTGTQAGIYLTNYETVRDGKLDPKHFTVTSLDEASVLRSFGGTKTFREFMRLFENVPYRFVATATPDPNEYIELLAYAAYLGIMDVSQAKTRFFKRDSTKADKLTLHAHKEKEFWLWCSSWALFLRKPSDLGPEYSDEGYDLPPFEVVKHEIPVDHTDATPERDGQGRMFREAKHGVVDAAREKRETLVARIAKAAEIVAASPGEHFLLWHDLEAERREIEKQIPGVVSVYGSQRANNLEALEQAITDFAEGRIRLLAAKPSMFGAGVNWQRHCSNAIFCGIGFQFAAFIQAIHRIYRFLQSKPVRIHLIYAESERTILQILMEKWGRHKAQTEHMAEIIQQYGLSQAAISTALGRSMGVERQEVAGPGYQLMHNDCIEEIQQMPDNSMHLILTSIPFSTQYEYTPSMNDFGHTDSNEHFFEQMEFLTPHLLRVLKPGRLAAIHVKDRIVPGGITGLGFQIVWPFHAECIRHFSRHGFAYMGMKTIVTDVVRENNQTYRLGWTEQCKDGSKMGVGMPEYLLIFRKPPTDTTNSYADEPVVKSKADYSRSRWQIDAHGFSRSNGNRPLMPEDLQGVSHATIFKLFRKYSIEQVYDFEHHVKLGEVLESKRILPMTFMLLQPQSWHPDVWTDITRMRTLNAAQSAKGREMHLCVARGTLVLTYDGYRPIEDLKIGEQVLTHRGRWRRITAKACTGIRPVIRVRAQGVADLKLTPDHQIWTRFVGTNAWSRDHSRKKARTVEPNWLMASDAQGHYVNLKLPDSSPTLYSATEWWIVGRWLGDGHLNSRHQIVISCAHNEADGLLKRLGVRAGAAHHGETATQIFVKDRGGRLRRLLARFGTGATGKRIPGEALALDPAMAESLLSGYLSADGHYLPSAQRSMATSVSRPLALGMALISQRAREVVAGVFAGRKGGVNVIQGRTVNTHDEWILYVSPRNRSGMILEDGAWKKVRHVEVAGSAEVWDISVEEDASFTAEGCIIQNCPMQFDIADRAIAQWTMPGETVLDPFGGLFTVPMCAVKLGRKAVSIELNPGYFYDGCNYVRAAELKASTPTLFDLMEAEEAPVEEV